MSLALYVLYVWLTSSRMAAMLHFVKMAAPSCARLGARQKCKPYGLVDLWAKIVVLFEESEPNSPFITLTPLTTND